jgi:hypothetical protein
MSDRLTETLLKKLQSDLQHRQIEFKNDYVISTAIQLALVEIKRRLQEDNDD